MPLQLSRVQKPVRKLRKLLKKMPSMPSPEEIHDFRTSVRRVESTLHVYSLDSGHGSRRTSKVLSRLRKRAGKVRDMDVLLEHASTLNHRLHTDGDEKDYSVRLLEYLGAQRLKRARQFHALTQQSGGKLSKKLKRISDKGDKALPPNQGRSEREAKFGGRGQCAEACLRTRDSRPDWQGESPFLSPESERAAKSSQNDRQLRPAVCQRVGRTQGRHWGMARLDTLVGIADDVLDHGAQCGLRREL